MTTSEPHRAGTQRSVNHPGGTLHVVDYPGQEPPIVLMHGFPDDHRIYDKLSPQLSPRRAVAFDFLGYGRSDRSDAAGFSPEEHGSQLAAVLDELGITRAVVVGHDASGPDGVAFAVATPTGGPFGSAQHRLRTPVFVEAPRDDPAARRSGIHTARRRHGQR
jgi:pimeloyl-ACP methyl ester carboxylesterase